MSQTQTQIISKSSTETTIGIHPIVILTISDYFTRIKVTSDNKLTKVFGGLLGQHIGSKCEIFSAFEFYNQAEDDSQVNLDFAYIDERRKLTEQLFPNYEIVGFFMTNSNTSPDPNCIDQVLKAMDFFGIVAPLCLVLSTDLSQAEELPVCVYQFVEKHLQNYIKLNHIIEGYESERICLDTVTKSNDFQNNESAMIQNLLTFRNALDVLKANLNLIRNASHADEFKNDPYFVSSLDELVRNYPNVNSPDLIEMLQNKEQELIILNNICADSINISLQGRIEGFSGNCNEEKRQGANNMANNINFNFK